MRVFRFVFVSLIFLAVASEAANAQLPFPGNASASPPAQTAVLPAPPGKPLPTDVASGNIVAHAPDPATNPLTLNNSRIYGDSLAALTMLFVVAVLLENAFAVIFNWRVFLTYFSLKGVKTIVMIAISFLVVHKFHIDVMATLIASYQSPLAANVAIDPKTIHSEGVSQFITALILAGGSAGINRIMTALGFRSQNREDEVAPRPPADKAWIAVRVNRKSTSSEIFVKIREIGPADANSPTPIAGVVGLGLTPLSDLFLRNANRFPQNGGYAVAPNVVYAILVTTLDAAGNEVKALDGQYVFAAGAIVDFTVKF